MKFRSTDSIAFVTAAWVVITLMLNFVLPHHWFFTYLSLDAETPVCRDSTQRITGVRKALMSFPASGVDQIYPVNINEASDRFEWSEGFYPSGVSTSTWRPTISVAPGIYEWRATTLKLNVLYIFPVYLTESERPVSNLFEVIDCAV